MHNGVEKLSGNCQHKNTVTVLPPENRYDLQNRKIDIPFTIRIREISWLESVISIF